MKKTASNVIKIAKQEVGYLEKKSDANLNSKTGNAGSNNYTKYNAVFGVNGCYWCAYFICWLFYTLCGNSKALAKEMLCGSLSGACETLRQAFVKAGRYFEKPKVGDLVFFTGTRHAGANHIALIYKITPTSIYTIEGNTSGASGVVDNGGGVSTKSYNLKNPRIMGYGRPKYEIETTAKTATSDKKKTLKVASADKFLNSLAKVYTTTTDLNLRTGAGADHDKLTVMPKGSKVRCYGYYSLADGVKWLLVKYNNYTGFCSSKYLK